MTDSNTPFQNGGFPGLNVTPSLVAGLLRGVCQCSNNLLWAVDGEGTILEWSPSGERLLGWERGQVINTPVHALLPAQAELADLMAQAKEQGLGEKEIHLRHAKGHFVPFALRLCPWIDDSGQMQGFVGVGSDQSHWYKFQEDLVRIDRLAEMGRMAAAIVHDLKNPLSIINQASGWGKVVAADAKGLKAGDRQELKKTLNAIEEQTARCSSITNQILDFVRERKPEHKEFSLQDLMNNTVRYLQPELKYPPVEVITDYPEHEVHIQSDYELLQQVVVNLLSNAIYAIREKNTPDGRLYLAVQDQERSGVIRITDNGPGIPEQKQQKIFELFYTTKPEGTGTGLGLSICLRIIHRLGGSLDMNSQPGTGTTFTILLPKQRPG